MITLAIRKVRDHPAYGNLLEVRSASRCLLRNLLRYTPEVGFYCGQSELEKLLPHYEPASLAEIIRNPGVIFDLPVPGHYDYISHRVRVRVTDPTFIRVWQAPAEGALDPEADAVGYRGDMSLHDQRAWTSAMAGSNGRPLQNGPFHYDLYFPGSLLPPKRCVVAHFQWGYYAFTPESDRLAARELRERNDGRGLTVCGDCGVLLLEPVCFGCDRHVLPDGVEPRTIGPSLSEDQFAEFRAMLDLPQVDRPLARYEQKRQTYFKAKLVQRVVDDANRYITAQLAGHARASGGFTEEELEQLLRRPFVLGGNASSAARSSNRRPRSFRLSTPPESDT